MSVTLVRNLRLQNHGAFMHVKYDTQCCRKIGHEIKQGNSSADAGEKRLSNHERDGRFRNLLKKTYLKRWIGTMDFSGNEAEAHLNGEGNFSRRSNNMDFARLVKKRKLNCTT